MADQRQRLPRAIRYTNLLSPVVWQRFSGNPATNAGNFHQVIGPSLFISMFGPALRDWMFDVPLFI
jgi:hypothetical protein